MNKWIHGVSFILKQFNAEDITDELNMFLYNKIHYSIYYLHNTITSIESLEEYLAQSPKVYKWYINTFNEYSMGNSVCILDLWNALEHFEDQELKRAVNYILEEFVNITLDQVFLYTQTQQRSIPTIEDLVELLIREDDLISLLFKYLVNLSYSKET